MSPGVVTETDLAGTTKSEYIFFDGERIARRDGVNGAGGVFYYISDHLKTASVITDASGTVKAESDYYPWGGELQIYNNFNNTYKFTGQEHDSETNLDYFGGRYYSNALGRFMSTDWSGMPVSVPYADFYDPQSLNLYSYVRNLPTTSIDDDGHDCTQTGQRFDCNYHFPDSESGKQATAIPMPLPVPVPVRFPIVGVGTLGTATAGGAVIGAAYLFITRTTDAIVANNQDEELSAARMSVVAVENVLLMSKNKDTLKVIMGLTAAAATELGKVTGKSPDDNHHKKEGKAMLDRAKRLAERLPGKLRDAVLQGIRGLEGTVPGGMK